MNILFPSQRATVADFVVGTLFLALCFVFFLHQDIYNEGWCSLHYLFGPYLAFYDGCAKDVGLEVASYLPPTYVAFALWLYPFKLLGLLTGASSFPVYLAYWLKTLTTLTYAASSVPFYRISLIYLDNPERAKYATAAWLVMPLAFFSQFIFSQYDIFHVLLTIVGFLMFLRNRLYWASVSFAVAITFKTFPAFVYLPLLLLHEKRLSRLALHIMIFATPTVLFDAIYSHSPAFIDGVRHLPHFERVYVASIDTFTGGFWRAYIVVLAASLLCAFAYFTEAPSERRIYAAAYFWLAGSILPFCLILWHPQWLMSVAPAITLTTLVSRRVERFMTLDLIGMFLFVGTVCLTFQRNVDAAMFRGQWVGLNVNGSHLMANLFNFFGDHSRNVFLSGFIGYLLSQLLLKYDILRDGAPGRPWSFLDYNILRSRLYLGSMIFILPASFAIGMDIAGSQTWTHNEVYDMTYDATRDRHIEQTIIATGRCITRVAVLMDTSGRTLNDDISIEIVDSDGRVLRRTSESIAPSHELAWHTFDMENTRVSKDASYTIRLSSLSGSPGNAFTLNASVTDTYRYGAAVIAGIRQSGDLAFRVWFTEN